MDNRWRILYYKRSEMWGRMYKSRAGRGKPGRIGGSAEEGKPLRGTKPREGPKESREA